MAIEVRQLVIKSTVVKQEPAPAPPQAASHAEIRELKASILSECKQAIREALKERRER